MFLLKLPIPKKLNKKEIVITSSKMLHGLVILLALFCCLKIISVARAEKKLVNTSASFVLSQIKDINDTESFNKYFTASPFCGWKLEAQAGKIASSPDFEKTSEDGDIINREFEMNGTKQNFAICISEYENINNSVNRQIILVVILTAAIFFLINYREKK